MITFDLDEHSGILTVRPEEKLEAKDFEALSEAVDPFVEEKGGLAGLIILTEGFPGWQDFKGMMAHMAFVRDHHRQIEKVAVVTDSRIADVAEILGKHFIGATVRHFPFAELEDARRWISTA